MADILKFNKPRKLDDVRLGKVKWWNESRRMGFVVAGDDEFLITDKRPEITKALREGLSVRFVPFESIRGFEARELELVSEA